MTEEQKAAKKWLSEYKYIKLNIKREEEEIEYWRSLAEKITQTFSMIQANGGDKIQNTVENIVDLETDLNINIKKSIAKRKEIKQVIDKLENKREQLIINKLFIDAFTISQVAEILNLSDMQTIRLYKQALNHIYQIKFCMLLNVSV